MSSVSAADRLHKLALSRIEHLMDAKAGSAEGEELVQWADAVEAYETTPTPETRSAEEIALELRVEARHLQDVAGRLWDNPADEKEFVRRGQLAVEAADALKSLTAERTRREVETADTHRKATMMAIMLASRLYDECVGKEDNDGPYNEGYRRACLDVQEQLDPYGLPTEGNNPRARLGAEGMRQVLTEFRDHVVRYATQWADGGGSHHHPIWGQVSNALSPDTPAGEKP